ncbi:MAG: hypothetical protein HC895_02325 [Leptolyngbyaceae cyanobacterium SM1_3_5]|nr:hypothetical protein [Leptolyngbyaceae cyanobacterium SM1_3_5]
MLDIVLLQSIQAAAAPLCPIAIWITLIGFLWAVSEACRDGIQRLKKLHQIPCDRCVYFTGDYRLKCTVHPCKALSEEAIDCRDFEVTQHQSTSRYCLSKEKD